MVEIGDAVAIDREYRRTWCGGADGVVLGRADDEASAGAEGGDGERVGFGPAGGEYDVVTAGAEAGGDGLATVLEQAAGRAAGGMDAGGIAEQVECGDHGCPRWGAERLGRVGVEVDQRLLRGAGVGQVGDPAILGDAGFEGEQFGAERLDGADDRVDGAFAGRAVGDEAGRSGGFL